MRSAGGVAGRAEHEETLCSGQSTCKAGAMCVRACVCVFVCVCGWWATAKVGDVGVSGS